VACSQKGIVFASVHDSFWTHAADVPAMNATIRDKFIDLHENCDPSTGEPKYILSGECQTRRQAGRQVFPPPHSALPTQPTTTAARTRLKKLL
jgi:hypothetical protein